MGEDHAGTARPARLIRVTDAADERLADYRALTDVDLRTKFEPPHGLFIAEGELAIRRALRAGYAARSLLMSPGWLERMAELIRDADTTVYAADDVALEQVTGFHVHRGALASFRRKPLPTVEEVVACASRVVVLEDVVSHTNLGAIFRCAAGLGMDAVVLSSSCADPLYRRSVRVSMGEVFAIPYARADRWPDELDGLKSSGFDVVALTPSPDAERLDEVEWDADARLAVVFGTEGAGLSDRAVERADRLVRIPMTNGVDSLNVAAAAAVTFWTLGLR